MRFGGNLAQNITNAVASGDKVLQRDILLDEIAQLIEDYPVIIYGALMNSGCNISNNPTKKQLIDATVDNLQTNSKFRTLIPRLIVANKTGLLKSVISKAKLEATSGANGETFSNIGVHEDSGNTTWGSIVDTVGGLFGDDGGANVIENVGGGAVDGASSGGVWGGIIGVIGGTITSVFSYKESQNELEIANQQAKMDLYDKLMSGKDGKTNWMPIIIVGGVLILGSIVVFMTLKAKK